MGNNIYKPQYKRIYSDEVLALSTKNNKELKKKKNISKGDAIAKELDRIFG